MTKIWMVRQIGSGADVKVKTESNSREEAIKQVLEETCFPWHVRKITARPAKDGEQDDRVELQF